MKYFITAMLLTIAFGVSLETFAQDPEYVVCRKIGDVFSQPVAFRGACPVGWYQVD